uniref:Uncharacterized protein n=1 Tax=Acanthochromis polyacanthus TaxID=80966 RepID=A0A3Q1FEV9_9TELE
MADLEERQNLLEDEDEDRQTPRGPGRPMLPICDPSHLLHRVVVLVFMCFLGFGEQFLRDPDGSLWRFWTNLNEINRFVYKGSLWCCRVGRMLYY